MSATTGVNKVILFGEITSELVTKDANCFVQGCFFTIITHEMVRRAGEQLPHTEIHKIKLSKAMRNGVEGQLQIGRKIYVEGRIETISYTDFQGVKRYHTCVDATRIELLSMAAVG